MADIFISYSSEDNDVARALRAYLEAEGYSCWMAPDDVKGPRTYPEQIMSAIEESRAMVILVSQAANDSGHVANEVSAAFDAHKAILPIRVEDVQPARSLAYLLRLQQWVDAFPGPIDRHADALRDSLAALLGAVEELPEVGGKKRLGLVGRLRKRSPSLLAVASLLLVAVLAVVAFGIFQLISQLQAVTTPQGPGINAGPTVDAGAAPEVKANPSVATAPGQIKWSFQTDASFYGAPLVADGAVYTGNVSHSAVAVDLKTGQQKWAVQMGGDVEGSPAISGTTVLVTAENKYLYALDADTGKPLWKTKVEMPPSNTTPQLSEPVSASGLVVFGSADGMLRAFDVATGQQRWTLMAGAKDVPPHARLSDGVVVFASYSQYVGAVNASTGQLLWRKDLSAEFDGLPCIDAGVAYFRTDSTLSALDLKTGKQRWSAEIEAWGGKEEMVLPSPAAGDGIVCFPGAGNSLVALDAATGKQIWTFQAQEPIAPPAVSQGMVCFGSQDSSVYGLDAKTGEQRFKCVVGDPLITQTTLDGGVAYVGGQTASLFAVQALPSK